MAEVRVMKPKQGVTGEQLAEQAMFALSHVLEQFEGGSINETRYNALRATRAGLTGIASLIGLRTIVEGCLGADGVRRVFREWEAGRAIGRLLSRQDCPRTLTGICQIWA